jgi:hypothetical protein
MSETHAILILEFDNENLEQKENILKEARAMKAKLERPRKSREEGFQVKLCATQKEFEDWMGGNSRDSRNLNKIHIVTHGNEETCGNYNADGLAELIAPTITGKRSLNAITIHSCYSGSAHHRDPEHPDPEHPEGLIFVQQFASGLMGRMTGGNFSENIVLRGSAGRSYTDSQGSNWVLINDKVDPSKELARFKSKKEERKSMEEKYSKPRRTARPKFAIKNVKGYQDVTRVPDKKDTKA